jgi:23S rRNA (guanosine2251-2'-O)-methyltransferase
MEILVGRNSVREALIAGRRQISKILLAEGVAERGTIADILQLSQQSGIPVSRVRRRELDRVGDNAQHQGVAAQVSFYPYVEYGDLLGKAGELPFLLALDSLQDPQNVGSLLRTAEAVGVHGVILPKRRSAQVTPAVSRASAGAVEHLSVAQVVNLARTLDDLKAGGVWVVGLESHPEAKDYRTVDLNMPLVLVVGSEGRGLRRLVAERCDWLLRVPMRGRINSLNVSVAGSLALYQAWTARG